MIPTTRSDFTRELLGIRAMLCHSGRRYVNVTRWTGTPGNPVGHNHHQYQRFSSAPLMGTAKAVMWASYLVAIRGTLQRPLDFDQFCEVIRPPMLLRPGDPMYPFELVPLA